MTPTFEIFNQTGLLFIPQHDLIELLVLQKRIGLSLSHLVPEIHGPKVGLCFYQNVLCNSF